MKEALGSHAQGSAWPTSFDRMLQCCKGNAVCFASAGVKRAFGGAHASQTEQVATSNTAHSSSAKWICGTSMGIWQASDLEVGPVGRAPAFPASSALLCDGSLVSRAPSSLVEQPLSQLLRPSWWKGEGLEWRTGAPGSPVLPRSGVPSREPLL